MDKLIFEISKEGRVGYKLPESEIPSVDMNKIFPEEQKL